MSDNTEKMGFILFLMVLCMGGYLIGYVGMFESDNRVRKDCLKSTTEQHYSVDEISKLCGVVK
jgi:hypothetical protein